MPRKYLILPIVLSFFLLIVFSLSKAKPTYSLSTHIVISEVQIAGDSADPANDEFVELYNPTGSDIVMTGWRLTRKNSAGTEANLVASLSGTIPAHGFFLIGHGTGYNGSATLDLPYSAPSNALTNNYTVLLYSDAGITLVDRVGFGPSAADPETSPVTDNPAANGSIERKSSSSGLDESGGNGEDTDNNNVDFLQRVTSDPQNTGSATETPSEPSATPTETLTPTPTLEPTPSETLTPTPTEEPTPTPTEELTPTPTEEATPTPTEQVTPTEEPTPTLEPTPTPSPVPTPSSFVIGVFRFPGRTSVCTLQLLPLRVRFMRIFLPRISCS